MFCENEKTSTSLLLSSLISLSLSLFSSSPSLTCQDLEHLRVRSHRRRGPGPVGTRHVEVALEELSEPPPAHRGLVAAVDLADVVALDVADAVQGHEAGEGDLIRMGGEKEREERESEFFILLVPNLEKG